MAREEIQVSVAAADPGEFAEMVERLERAGMRVEQQLADIGVITGQIEGVRVDGLTQITGVQHVERSRTVGIPPGEQGDQDAGS